MVNVDDERVAAERELVDQAGLDHLPTWLAWTLPGFVGARGDESPDEAEALFAEHHLEFWSWLADVDEARPDPCVGVWARGGAKSTSAELGAVALGCTARRRYGLYVCETQDQADDHVANVGSMLESERLAELYPDAARKAVNQYGSSKGWRRNRLRSAAGFTIDALGLDTASRGVKLDDQRPDFIVFDDLDDPEDSPRVVARKIRTITKGLLPAGAKNCAVIAIQNLVHRDGVFARLVDGRADFLARRQVSGPVPAVRGLVTEHRADPESGKGRDVIVAGEATWSGQDLDTCQAMIDEWGLVAFLEEAQHDVTARAGALWSRPQLARARALLDTTTLVKVTVAVDPSGGDGPDNDAQGILVAGLDGERRPWVLDDLTCSLPPHGWARVAILAWFDWDADDIVAEVNYGGAMVEANVAAVAAKMLDDGEIDRMPKVQVVTASKGKRVRAEPVAALYGRPDDAETWSTARAHHGGHFVALEDEMTTWDPDTSTWSPNRVDVLVWGVSHLLGLAAGGRKRRRRKVAA